jgi:hypothetical protein
MGYPSKPQYLETSCIGPLSGSQIKPAKLTVVLWKMFFCLYNLAGFNIKYIHCDNEYQSLMNELQEAYNYANAQEHAPEIGCSITVVKESFRATFYCLPFLKLPAVMVKILAMENTKKFFFLLQMECLPITAHV